MGEKKGKALALELIDDLLAQNKADGQEAKNQKEQKKKQSGRDDKGKASSRSEEGSPIPEELPAVAHDATVQLPGDDRTVPIQQSPQATAVHKENSPHGQETVPVTVPANENIRASVGRFAAMRTGAMPSSTEAALAQSENLRIAQTRILELEAELERIRLQNEELGAAGETLRRRTDELLTLQQARENEFKNSTQAFEHEVNILNSGKQLLQKEVDAFRRKNEELEIRLSTNFQKIRVRERELENRLELIKMESAALVRSKDELILDLKRQIDQFNIELNNYRVKNQELNRQHNERQESSRRTIKALRLALSMLEGEDESNSVNSQRKAK